MWKNEEGHHHGRKFLANEYGNDSPISKLLQSQPNIEEDIIQNMCTNVTYSDLSALNKDDLNQFGIKDTAIQSILVGEFSTLTKQRMSLKSFINELKANAYQEKIYYQVKNQLAAISLMLEAIEKHTGPNWNNVLVKPNVYLSDVLLRTLKEVSEQSLAMRMEK